MSNRHRRRHRPALALVAVTVALAMAVPAGAYARGSQRAAKPRARAVLIDAGFRAVGTVDFFAARDGKTLVTYAVHATALSPGFYGMHVHTVGVCDPRAQSAASGVSAFASSGGHFKGAGGNHGSHDGDLPPILIGRDGRAAGSVVVDRLDFVELIDRPQTSPAGGDGSAVVLHARADNLGNIPARYKSTAAGAPDSGPDAASLATGDAGDRFACGPIQ